MNTRIVLAKLGMDAHWRGVAAVGRLLRDAGYEVIYLGHASPEQLAATVVAEDADVVGLSSLSGNHMREVRRLVEALKAAGAEGLPIVLGGTIPPADAEVLLSEGVAAVFGPGTPGDEIVEGFRRLVAARA